MNAGRPDTSILLRHLAALSSSVEQLRRHRTITLDALRLDRDAVWIVERGLQLCAQNALDIATHLAAAAGRDAPDYATAIDHLVTLGVLDAPFGRTFRAIAGFRNILVHAYLEVDLTILHSVLQHRLDDFVAFEEAVRRHLAATKP